MGDYRYNPALMPPSGQLDPYGFQGGEFRQNPQQLMRDQYSPPSNPMAANDQRMMNPQNAAYGAALMNIGDIIGGRGPSQSVSGAYTSAKQSNNYMRQNKAAMDRQARQDELNTRYRESQITNMNRANDPKAQKIGPNSYGIWNAETMSFDPIQSPSSAYGAPTELTEGQNRYENIISDARKEFDSFPAIKQYKAVKSQADTYDRSTTAYLKRFDDGGNLNKTEELDLVLSFYKIKDPGSTVSTPEVEAAKQAAWKDKAEATLNEMRGGGSLTRGQVESFRMAGLASASSFYDSVNSRANEYTSQVVNTNPLLAGRAGEIVMPGYTTSPSWHMPADQRFAGNPSVAGANPPPIHPSTATQADQELINFFLPQQVK